MKELFIGLVLVVGCMAAASYIYQIKRKFDGKERDGVTPALSTWIIFFLGTILSFVTYLIAEEHDFRSGILIVIDTIVSSAILSSVIVWGNRTKRLNLFEKWFLVGIGLIIVYGTISGNAWNSNIFAQILISIGYIPTFQKLITQKKNTESYAMWGFSMIGGYLGIYPAIGRPLAVLYSIRTIISVSAVLSLMIYYDYRQKITKSVTTS